MKKEFNIKKIIPASAMAILLAGSFILPAEPMKQQLSEPENTVSEKIEKEVEQENPFNNIGLIGKSAIVFDIKNNKSIFELNSDEVLPLASVTKMLLAPVAFDILPGETEISIKKEFLQPEGDNGLLVDERWLLKDLVAFSLTVSSNDGARAIASYAGAKNLNIDDYELGRIHFVSLMNKKAKEFGMLKTQIKNETGLDEDEEISGAYSTAREVALMFEKLLLQYPELVGETSEREAKFTSLNGIDHEIKNTNLIVNSIPGIMFSKTGFTDLAGGNLAILFDPGIGRPVVAVILGSTIDGRFEDIQALVKATREYILQEKTEN
ncbi:MAG: serine hydrolase [Patescibacteria group bacterium]